MAIVICEHGHYYDDKKHKVCPYCSEAASKGLAGKRTVASEAVSSKAAAHDTVNMDVYLGKPGDMDKTVGAYSLETGTERLTGWLVCTKGPMRGRDLKLFHGWNWAGRDYSMRICVPDDQAISAKRHMAIVFDDKGAMFYAIGGDGTLTYINGVLLEGTVALNSGDVIELGESAFVFIPYCTEDRKW